LSREQTYTQLLTAVNGHEKTVDGLKKHNDAREEELHALRIANEDAGEDEPISNTDPVGLELQQLQEEINKAKKEFEIINNRRKNIQLVSDQVSGWSRKTVAKLNAIILDGS